MTGNELKKGDKVYARRFGMGKIIDIDENKQPYNIYPVYVKFKCTQDIIKYTREGKYYFSDDKYIAHGDDPDDVDIQLVHWDETPKLDSINPSHYRVEGVPEAIEIMRGLMTDEQLEGFLWGNILKYAYRYGRKGDKKETAGKIGWYAEHLAELWRKEKSKEKKS